MVATLLRCAFLAALLVVGAPAQERLGAGQEGPLAIPESTAPGVLYLPSDWKPGRRLPLLFFMHGSGGQPTTWPWRAATGGRGYIVVGLPYGAQADAGAGGIQSDPQTTEKMVALIDRVRRQIDESYGVDQQHVILSGLSMGGWGVNFYGFVEAARDRYAGYAILAAGPRQDGQVKLEVTAGYPVLLLNGADDQNLAAANAGKPRLEEAGADVEQVILVGQGHVPSTESMVEPLAKWLAKVDRFVERRRGIAAVAWEDVLLAGELPQKKDDLEDWLATAPILAAREKGRPLLLYGYSRAEEKGGKPTRAARNSAKTEEDLFLFPTAKKVPAALRGFDCLRFDVGRIDSASAGLFAEKSAPHLVVLDAEHRLVVALSGRALGESAVLAKLLEALPEQARAEADELADRFRGLLAELVKTEKEIEKERKALQKHLAARQPAEKAIAEHRTGLLTLEARREEIATELRAPRKP